MNKIVSLFVVLFSLCICAQQKITVEQIYSGAFRSKSMDELQSLKNTNQYTVLNFDEATKTTQIDLYDFATLKKSSRLIDSKNFLALSNGIDSYVFSKDEKQIVF